MVRLVRHLTVAAVGQACLLAVFAATVGLDAAGWAAGLLVALAVDALLLRGLRRVSPAQLNPAHLVTLTRASLVAAVTALAVDGWTGGPRAIALRALVVTAAIALALDAVDGQVARHTGHVTALGARFDMEVDAFLIAVLSAEVAQAYGWWWVASLGLARYAYVAAGWAWPWLREPPPPRHWRKVVAAIVGVTLTVAAARVLPVLVTWIAVVIAAGLLAESFGRDVWWLRRRHHGLAEPPPPRRREVLGWLWSGGALLLVWAALAMPVLPGEFTADAAVRIPLELMLLVAVGLVLPRRSRIAFAAAAGALIGALAVLKALNIGFSSMLDRPFRPLIDLGTFGSAVGVLRSSVGAAWTVVAEVAVALLVVLLLVGLAVSAVRLTGVGARHRKRTAGVLIAVTAVWSVCLAAGVRTVGAPVASAQTSSFAYAQARQMVATIGDQAAFARQLRAADPVADTPPAGLLTALRGKDVLLVVVESYGDVAVQNTWFSTGVDTALRGDAADLQAAGFSSRSGFLTSPTFGGISWLAHSTVQSGLWIDSQQRYDQLMASSRFTLSDAFRRAGWRTVADIPSNYQTWPPGSTFYHYDKVYDSRNVGYAGPRFSYAMMPDQYTLAALDRNELARPHRQPVFAEIDLVSSHTPWAPLPRIVPWDSIGDGSVFDPMPAQGRQPAQVWRTARGVQAAYAASIRYSLAAITSFVAHSGDDNLVLVVYGDHQPSEVVSGTSATHDVPISIIAHDPAVLARISSWGWQPGLLPDPQGPIWPMDQFRDRFLAAFGPAG